MIGFERLTKTPAGVQLGSLELIADGSARNFVLEIGSGHFYGFVVRKNQTVYGYVDLCPHRNVPLAAKLDDYLTPKSDLIVCSWHGALFKIEDGACVGGPCNGENLKPWPVAIVDGQLVTR